MSIISALRALPGFEGFYAVTKDGRVRSLERVVIRRNGVPMTVRARWLRPVLREDGYHSVNVHMGATQKKLLVHHAVARAWLPSPLPHQTEINHKDGVKTHNGADNLEWCTSSENKLHAVALGLINFTSPARKRAAAKLGRTKRTLSDPDLSTVRELIEAGASIRSIAKQHCVAWLTIARIKRGETYRSSEDVCA